mgnify:CR=1 FL=1
MDEILTIDVCIYLAAAVSFVTFIIWDFKRKIKKKQNKDLK